MFNKEARDLAVKDCEKAVEQYNFQREQIQYYSELLFSLRKNSKKEVFQPIESFINNMKNTPVEFDKSFEEFNTELKNYDNYIKVMEAKINASDFNAGIGGGTMVMIGGGVAALGPSAALAIATTFGTASTGTAISTLSGAVATKAALAWRGCM